MKYVKLLLLFFLLSAKVSFSQWIPSTGIDGGYCMNIINVDTALFMFCDGIGIVRQNIVDNSWVKVYEQPSSGLINVDNVLFTQTGLYQTNTLVRSFNLGNTWEIITYDTLSLGSLTKVGNELFAWDSEHFSIVKSADYGSSWSSQVNTGFQSYCFLYSDLFKLYYIDYNNPEFLYCFNSQDNTVDSVQTPTISWISDVQSFDSCLLIIADSIFNYKHATQQWTVTSNDNLLRDFVLIDTVLYGTGSKGLFRFNKINSTWDDCNDGLPSLFVNGLTFCNGNFYCACDMGTYRCDTSFVWQNNNYGLNGANILFIATYDDQVWVSTSVGVYKLIDGGTYFNKVLDGIYNKIILTDSAYYLMGEENLLISNDKGENWNSYPFGFLPWYGSVSDIGFGRRYIFAVATNITGEKLYRTDYYPVNWQPVQGTDILYLWNLAVNDSIVLLSKYSSSTLADPVLISYSNGENPQIVAEFHNLFSVDVRYLNNKFYATYQNQIAYSSDNLITWEYITVPDYSMRISDFDHDSANLVVAGWYYGYSPKAYNSYDNGTSWTDITGNLQHPLDHTLTKTKISGNRVFMGTPTCGVWYREDLLTELPKQMPISVKKLSILPNPNHGEFEIELVADHESPGILRVTDQNSKIIRNEVIFLHSGLNRIKYALKNSDGLFYIELITNNNNNRYSGKVLIIR